MAQAQVEFVSLSPGSFISGGQYWTTHRQWYNSIPGSSMWYPNHVISDALYVNSSNSNNFRIAVTVPARYGQELIGEVERSKSTSSTVSVPTPKESVICGPGNGNCFNGHAPSLR